MDVMQEKCDRMLEMLTKRNLERKLDIAKDREDKKLTDAENEKIDFYTKVFAEKKQEIECALEQSRNIEKTQLACHFNDISKDILTLQKYVAGSNLFLRTYDIKKCQEILQELTTQAKDLEDLLIPKKKFGFKTKKLNDAKINGNNVNGKGEDKVDSSAAPRFKFEENLCGFNNVKDSSLFLERTSMFKKDVALANLENCKVKLFGSPSTLHINYLKDSFVFCGPVSTSIFVENCSNCTLIIACQQLRLHSSSNVHIYLHVTSRAIMEDCKQIYIAPYNLKYERMEEDFEASGLNKCANNWMSVDDFNWLNTEKKSPNWSILDESKRVNEWTELD